MSPIESTEVLSYVQWLVMLFWLLHPVPLTVDFSLLQVKTMSIRTSVPVYDVASLIPLRRLVEAIPLKENACLVDHIGNPFELGLSEDVRADYAESLLSSATGWQIIARASLLSARGTIRGRVENALYRRNVPGCGRCWQER